MLNFQFPISRFENSILEVLSIFQTVHPLCVHPSILSILAFIILNSHIVPHLIAMLNYINPFRVFKVKIYRGISSYRISTQSVLFHSSPDEFIDELVNSINNQTSYYKSSIEIFYFSWSEIASVYCDLRGLQIIESCTRIV